jgi:four helix bundle protein
MKDFRQLQVWHKAHALSLLAYDVTAHFPREERFGLTSQIRRASYSIPINIAEGCGRGGNGELHRFLNISAGSASELQYEWLLARDLKFVSGEQYELLDKRTTEVKRMLSALIDRVAADRQAK